MPSSRGKILIIRGGAIGDFILTLPVLSALRERFPETRRELLTYPRVAPLALAGGLVDDAQSIDARPMASFFAKSGRLPTELAAFFAGFDLIISYLFDPDLIFRENVDRCSKAQFIAGPHRPDETGSVHATEAFLRPLVQLAIFDADPTPRLDPSAVKRSQPDVSTNGAPSTEALSGEASLADSDWLALHPGSGSERKNWPEHNWRELITHLAAETSMRLLLVGGEAEGDRPARLAATVPRDRVKVAQNVPLPQLALLLSQCSGYIGHDSGISHLAAAVGLRGLVLWGDTRQEIWRPRSDRFQLLSHSSGLTQLDVQTVLAALLRIWRDDNSEAQT